MKIKKHSRESFKKIIKSLVSKKKKKLTFTFDEPRLELSKKLLLDLVRPAAGGKPRGDTAPCLGEGGALVELREEEKGKGESDSAVSST
jgi:hypothetical protein